ncbi:MAG: protein kinase domain-containing protein [Gemmatimonadaceae bacterium]
MTDQLFDHLQTTLGDSYRLERELGGGGMGRVFVAEETTLERKVVVKVLPPEMGRSMSADRFRREIQLAAKLQHPHIVPLLAAGGTPDGMLYYTMPYIEGDSLRRRVTRAGELPIPEALRILRQVVDALAYAHARGVVHRDIKPDNVLLSGNHAMVTDFGVSKALSTATGPTSLTSLGVALGTPAYMAPEQAAADPNTDHRADIYAIGILAYELLTGHPPFHGNSPQQVLAAHATIAPPRIIPIRTSVSQLLEDLVMCCLEKRPADRPQTAEEVLQRLESLSTPTYGTTPMPMQPTVPVKPEKRFPTGKVVAVGAAAGVIALAALGSTFLRRDNTPADLTGIRVLLAPFDNRSRAPSLDALGTMATDWIARIAENEAGLETVVGSEGSGTTEASVIAAARSGKARMAISGSYYGVGDTAQFQVTIFDAGERRVYRTLGPFPVVVSSPNAGLEAMGKRLAGALAFMSGSGSSLGRDLSTALPGLDAARVYQRADAMSVASQKPGGFGPKTLREVISTFFAAHHLDSAFTWPLVRAAHFASLRANCALTDSIGNVLAPARTRMAEPEEAYLDRLLAWCRGDWSAAYAAAHRLRRAAPRSDEALAVVGYASQTVGRVRESATAFAAINRPFSGTGQYQWYGDALHLLGDFRKELELAREAQRQFPEDDWGFFMEARALAAQRRMEEAIQVHERVTSSEAGFARVAQLGRFGSELAFHGALDAARTLFAQAADWFESQPPASRTRADSLAHIRMLAAAGRGDDALQMARTLARAPADSFASMSALGHAAAAAGQRSLADSVDRWLASQGGSAETDIRLGIGTMFTRGSHTMSRVLIAAALGDVDRAATLMRQVLSEGYRPSLIGYHYFPEFAGIRDNPKFAELLRIKD